MMQIVKHSTVAEDAIIALQEVRTEASDLQNGLITRFPNINRALMKYFRFDNIYLFSGASGSGKSYLLNQFRTDLTDTHDLRFTIDGLSDNVVNYLQTNSEFNLVGNTFIRQGINKNVNFTPIYLHFSLEMSGAKELMRTTSSMTKLSYGYIYSSQLIRNEKDEIVYNKLSENEINLISKISEAFAKRTNILTFRRNVNIENFVATIKQKISWYTNTYKDKNLKFVIAIDHTLLFNRSKDQKGDLVLQDDLIKAIIGLKEEYSIDIMFIIISQFNSEIEKPQRKTIPSLHYPTKSDIYMGGQLYQGSDYVGMLYSPAYNNITEYGENKLPTYLAYNGKNCNINHLSFIKTRYGEPGQTWLLNNLGKGEILPLSLNEGVFRVEKS